MKKSRKSIIAPLLALLILSALILSSCGGQNGGKADLSDSKYVGTWKTSNMSIGDQSEPLEDEWIITIKEDGTGISDDGKETTNFTWKPIDGGFKTSGDVNTTFKDDGDNIKTSIFGVDLIFEKQ